MGHRLKRFWGIVLAFTVGTLAFMGKIYWDSVSQPVVPIVIAARDIKEFSVLGRSDVAVVKKPAVALQADMAGSLDEVLGKTNSMPLLAGEPILKRKLMTSEMELKPGEVAYAFPVDLARSAGGVVFPGDLVDIWVTVQRDAVVDARPLIRKVRVIAIKDSSNQTLGVSTAQGQNVKLLGGVPAVMVVKLSEGEVALLDAEVAAQRRVFVVKLPYGSEVVTRQEPVKPYQGPLSLLR